MKWRPRVIGIEQAGLSTTLHYFQLKCKLAKTYFRAEPLRPKNRVKNDRIRTNLEPVISTNRLFISRDQRVLKSQVDFFPNIKEDAVLDCLGYYPEIALVGTKAEKDKIAIKKSMTFLDRGTLSLDTKLSLDLKSLARQLAEAQLVV